jgi:hypothetical protein
MKYATSAAFRTALDQRLKNVAAESPRLSVERLRKAVAIERFLARLELAAPGSWLLKGGVALDYRLRDRSRSTQDLDLETANAEDRVGSLVLDATEVHLDDYFTYSVRRVPLYLADEEATTLRFRIEASIGGKRFDTVTLDVGIRDAASTRPETVVSRDLLRFADIPPVEIPTIPLTQHLTEKLHAYSRVYAHDRPSSRVKDLVDIVLIVTEYSFEAEPLLVQIRQTFSSRGLHDIPRKFNRPPDFWAAGYQQMAQEITIDPDIDSGHRIASAFFDQVLSGTVSDLAVWDPETRCWQTASESVTTGGSSGMPG